MGPPNLLMICISSFTAVFALLAFLAAVMKILMHVFPEKVAKTDAAVLAAVTTAISAFYPGTKITKVEEIK